MNWQDNLRRLAQLAGDMAYEQDADFQAILPAAVEFAELKILRDLDLLSTRVEDSSGRATANSKRFVLPTAIGTFIVVEEVRVIDPNGIYGPPLWPMSRESIDMIFPDRNAPSNPSVPQYWAPFDQATLFIGPPPDQNYYMAIIGTMRPTPLNPKSTTGTFISTQLPDLFIAAEAEFLIGAWQKNWSPQADDPVTAAGWGAEYQRLMTPAAVEEARKRLASTGWGSRLPNPIATPPQS